MRNPLDLAEDGVEGSSAGERRCRKIVVKGACNAPVMAGRREKHKLGEA